MWFYLLAIVVFLVLIHLLVNYNERARLIRRIPGPKDTFILGNAPEVPLDPVDLWKLGRQFAKCFKDIYRIWIYPLAVVNIYNPEDIEKIIATTKFNEKSVIYSFLKPWLQEGLLLSRGKKWQNRRKILTPAFHFNILKEFCIILEENSHRLVDRLKKTCGETIDITPIISEYTLHSICETAMGSRLDDTGGAGKSYKQAIYALGTFIVERFMRIPLFSDFIFNLTTIAREQNKQLETLHKFTETIIEERKEYIEKNGVHIFDGNNIEDDTFMMGKKKKIAMLDLLLLAEKEGSINRQGIQEEVDTFMFEGHDTTASGLTYCLMLLANHKDVQDKVVAELHEIFGESDRPATIEDLNRMRYLDCCIKESMRLYPPVPFISRNIDETVELSNYKIPPGTMCHIHIFDLHRREDLFQNALQFEPDRFLPKNSVGRHPYSYIPFSAGPRNCIGQKFATLEMKSCVSATLRNFALEPVTKEADIEIISDLVLRNHGPVSVKMMPRNKPSFS
ncbi:cytochrome P450 4C1-like [Pectinophora gossypiella]|uniref:cytochrome P450 4C1-like n=1 Tax=Pectinophora gossypiella TaxID=13191 RepID=UPI00214EE66D|nr:cytochrome P450 4C1-like [Pectinophora gossypiella]